MFSAVLVTVTVIGALALAARPGASRELISRRRYSNRYSDASGAREDHL